MTPEDFKKIASVSYDNVMKKQKKEARKIEQQKLDEESFGF